MRSPLLAGALLGVCALLPFHARAQEVVHALSGTVTKIDSANRTLSLHTNDGSDGLFNFPPQASVDVDFDRDVKSSVTPVSQFNKPNDTVVVFYYGNGGTRTAVAVKDLGPGPFKTVEGTVSKYNRHQQEITIKDADGKKQTFRLDAKAVADSMNGAVSGQRFDPSNGDNVRVLLAADGKTALFVRD